MANLTVEIVTPEAALWQGQATSLKSRTSDGELMILAQHAPLVGDVLAGVLEVTSADGVAYVAVDGGYLHVVGGDHVSIVTELCEGWNEIDAAKAKADYDTALAALTATREDIASATWRARKHDVELAETRLRVVASKP